MRKEFSISNDKVLINFTAKYCSTFEELVESYGFKRVIENYLKKWLDNIFIKQIKKKIL